MTSEWLLNLVPGDFVKVRHTVLYPIGKRVAVKRVNTHWIELDNRMRFGRTTGAVPNNPCLCIQPWKAPK